MGTAPAHTSVPLWEPPFGSPPGLQPPVHQSVEYSPSPPCLLLRKVAGVPEDDESPSAGSCCSAVLRSSWWQAFQHPQALSAPQQLHSSHLLPASESPLKTGKGQHYTWGSRLVSPSSPHNSHLAICPRPLRTNGLLLFPLLGRVLEPRQIQGPMLRSQASTFSNED